MDKVEFVWQIEDVKELHPEFTLEQCRDTLRRFDKRNESSMSAMWDELAWHADDVAEECLTSFGEFPL
jgi:hypothetical protein